LPKYRSIKITKKMKRDYDDAVALGILVGRRLIEMKDEDKEDG
jgi:hypothetical protein